MKRTLVNAALFSLFAVPVAASAADASVTVSGWLNVDVENVKNGDRSVNRVSSNTSELVFAGEENMDRSLKVFFRLASLVKVDDGDSGGLANRDSWLGIGGDWGSVKFGRYLTPYELAHIVVDASYGTGIADTEAVMGNCGAFNGYRGCFDQRLSNSIQFTSPKWSGFGFAVDYVPDENRSLDAAGNRTNARVWSAAGNYSNGPFTANLAYETHYDGGLSVGATSGLRDWAVKLVGKYKFGDTSVSAAVERIEYEPSTSSKVKLNTFLLNGIQTFGAFDLGLQWVHAGNAQGTSCSNGVRPASTSYLGGIPNCGIGDSSADQASVFARYHLSKRSEVYALYTRISNDSNAAYDFTVNPAGIPAPGKSPSGVAVGIVHSF